MEKCYGKNRYKSEHEAKMNKEAMGKRTRKDLRVYQCNVRFDWHLTSKKHARY